MIFPLLLIVYVLAINFYAFLFMKEQKTATADEQKQADGKLSLIALLGGGIAVYTCMFVFKNRLNNLFFMLAVPLLSVFHLYLWIFAFRSGFAFFRM